MIPDPDTFPETDKEKPDKMATIAPVRISRLPTVALTASVGVPELMMTASEPVGTEPLLQKAGFVQAPRPFQVLVLVPGIYENPFKLAFPPGVVTDTKPELPLATTAVMVVLLTTLNEVAAVPPKLTAVAPVKLVPVMVTV